MNIPLFDFKTDKPAIGQRCLMYFEDGIVMLGWWQGDLLKDNHSYCTSTPLAWQPVDPRFPTLAANRVKVGAENVNGEWRPELSMVYEYHGESRDMYFMPVKQRLFPSESAAWLATIDVAAKFLEENG